MLITTLRLRLIVIVYYKMIITYLLKKVEILMKISEN